MITGPVLLVIVGLCSLHNGACFLYRFKPLLTKIPSQKSLFHPPIFFAAQDDDNGCIHTYYDKVATGISTDRIDQKYGEICRFNEDTKNIYSGVIREKLNMLWTYNSLAIEGNSLSYGDTIFFLQHGLSVAGRPIKDFLETSGHSEAIGMLQDCVGQTRPFSHYFACTINHLLMNNITHIPAIDTRGNRLLVPFTAGRYRTQPTHVLTKSGHVHRYLEAFLIEGEMQNLIDYVNGGDPNVHPILRAAIAHYNFVRIHPFQDGNGRGARILMNLVLIKAGLYPLVVQVADKVAYFAALRAADDGDVTQFVEFIASSMEKTLDIVLETIKSELT